MTSEVFTAYQESGSKARLTVEGCKGVRAEMMPVELRLSGKVAVR